MLVTCALPAGAQPANTWTSVGTMSVARVSGHTATVLPDGRVLIVGGETGNNPEFFDPATSTVGAAPALPTANPPSDHIAVLLRDGRVLVAGGRVLPSGSPLSAAFLFNPATNNWSTVGSLGQARYGASAAGLPDGRVLVTGGTGVVAGDPATLSSTELFDPASGSFSSGPSMGLGRTHHTMTRLGDGRVVIAGRSTLVGAPTAQIYDSASATFVATIAMDTTREAHTATLLPDGRVLIAGGVDTGGVPLASTELIDPNNSTATLGPSLVTARGSAAAVLLATGDVLVTGGCRQMGCTQDLQSTELLDPVSGGFFATNGMPLPARHAVAVRLRDGRVLVIGGERGGAPLSSLTLFTPESVRAYITNSGSNTVSVLDGASNATATALVATIPVGASPQGLAANLQGTRVYVANQTDGTLSVIDASAVTVTATIAVQPAPFGVAVTPDGSRVYVTSLSSGDLAVVDTASSTVGFLAIGAPTVGAAVASNGLLYVAVRIPSNDQLVEINTLTNTMTRTLAVAADPSGVAVSPDGTRVYVANQGNGTVTVVDVSGPSMSVVAVEGAGDNPFGVAVSPDGRWLYVANLDSTLVSVHDAASGVAVDVFDVGTTPVGIAVRPDGLRVYVANRDDNTVRILDDRQSVTTTALPESPVPVTSTALINVGSGPIAFGSSIGVVSAAAPGSADLGVSISASSNPALSGSNLTYTIQITNNGPNVAQSVTLTDTIPAGTTYQSLDITQGACMTPPGPTVTGFTCVIGALAVSQTVTATLVVQVIAPSGTVTNTVSIGGSVPDANAVNDTATVVTSITALGAISGKVTQTNGTTAIAGATITVHNSDTAAPVATATSLGDGTYSVPNLAPRNYRVAAQAPGFVLEYFNNQTTFAGANLVAATSATTTANINFTLAGNAGGISGRVTELDGVTGIGGALINVRGPNNEVYTFFNAAPDGTWDTGLILAPGTYKIRVTAEGFATAFYDAAPNHFVATPVVVSGSSTTSGILVKLSSVAGGISGHVTRAGTGAPLADVSVNVLDATTGSTLRSFATDASGFFSTGLLFAPGKYKVQASLAGSAPTIYNGKISVATGDPVTVTAGTITANIDLSMPLVSSITGRVTNASTSANLGGVLMQLLDYGTNTQLATTSTAGDGTYTFTNLTPGAGYKVRASLAGFSTKYWNGQPMQGTADLITLGTTAFTADFALSPGGGGISGRVFDPASGVPVGTAGVNVYEGSGTNFGVSNFVISVTTDALGNFNTGQVLAAGSYKVLARKFDSGYISTFHAGGRDLSTATPIAVTPSATTAIGDLAVPIGATITGTIRDRTSGLPIAGATVRVRRVASSDFFNDFAVTTNASGVFRATGLDLQSRWLIVAQANGYVLGWYSGDASNPGTDFGTALPVSVTVSATIPGIDISLARGGAVIEGRVTRSDNGQPLVGTSINIRGPLPRTTSVSLQVNADRTNGLGDFSIGSLPPGTYVVEADRSPIPNGGHAHGFHPLAAVSRASGIGVTVGDGDVASVAFQVYAFSPLESSRSIRGVLRGPGGVPVRNSFVHALEPHTGNIVRTVTAFHDGSYVMDGLRPGRYIIMVAPENGLAAIGYPAEPVVAASSIIDVTAGNANGIDIDLSDQHGTIAGRVTRSDDGQPIGGVSISLRNFHNNGVVAATGGTTRPDGTYEIHGVPFGPVKLRFSAPGYATAYASRTSDLGAPTLDSASFGVVGTDTLTNTEIRLTPGAGGVSGLVRTAEVFAPVVSTAIGIYDVATGSIVTTDSTDATGFFSNDSLAPGNYRITVSDGRGARYAVQWFDSVGTRETATGVTVTASTIAPGINFVVVPINGTISGTAYESDGTTPLRGVGVTVFDAATGGFVRRGGVTNVDGQYEVSGLAPGVAAYIAQGRALGRADQYYEEAATFGAATAVTVTASVTTPGIDFRMVTTSADVAVTMSAPTTAFSFGDFPYTITVTNNGPDTADNVVLRVPMNVTGSFQSVTTSLGTCRAPPVDATNDEVACELGPMGNAATATITLVVRVLATGGDNVTHAATVTSFTPDPTPANNADMLITAVFAAGSFSGQVVLLSDGITPIPGALITVYNSDTGFVVATTTSLIDGTYTVFNLPPRNYKASVQVAGFRHQYYNLQSNFGVANLIPVTSGANTPTVHFLLTPGGGGISGRITQLDGVTGIGGAAVTIRDAGTGNSVLTFNTDATGNYATDLILAPGTYKVRASATGFATRYYVAAPSILSAGIVTVTGATTTASINVFLSSITGGISGRVTRAGTGAAIGGAAISISDAFSGAFVQGFQTDAVGNYSTGFSLSPGTYKVQVSLAGSAPIFYLGKISVATGDPVPVLASTITPNIDFSVPFTSSITGRVTDALTTANLSGVNVQLLDYATNAFITSVNTAADGTYSFLNLTPGNAYRLRASRATYATQYWNGKPSPGTADVIRLGTTAFTADFALQPNAGGISGRIVSAVTGAGVSGAFVNVYDGATTNFAINNFVNGVTTDVNGFFNTGQIFAPGTYKLVSGNNNLGYTQTFHVNGRDLSTATPITVTGATLTALPDLSLPLGATITGTIRDRSTGLPIAGATVAVQRVASSNFFNGFTVTTNASGVFRSTGLDLNGQWLVLARAPGYVAGWHSGDPNQLATDFNTARPISVTATAQTISNIDLNLEPGGAVIQGRVTRADNGLPVLPGTTVQVRGPLPRSTTVTSTTSTNGLGDFSIGSLPPGRYTIEGTGVNVPNGNAIGFHPLGAVSRGTGLPVAVTGTQVATVNFEVPAFSGGVTPRAIRGTVRGPGGVVVRNALVFAFEPHAQGTVRVVGAFHDGSFVIDGLPQGRYLVGVSPESGFAALAWPAEPTLTAAQIVDITAADAAGIDLVVSDQHGTISGRVVRSDNGQPIMGASVGVRNFHGNAIRGGTGGVTTADGTYLITGLPPGFYKVNLSAPGFKIAFASVASDTGVSTAESSSFVQVTAGANSEIDIALAPAGPPLTGSVKMQGTLAPVVATIIAVRDAVSGEGVFTTTTDAAGAFTIESLGAGGYRLQALDVHDSRFATRWYSNSNTREAGQTVTVPASGVSPVVDLLVSPVNGTISGFAYEADGVTPLRDVGIAFFDRATGGFVRNGGVTDQDGRYETSGLAPGAGAYVARARALGYLDQFYREVTTFAAATAVTVTASATTPGVDFKMATTSADLAITMDGRPNPVSSGADLLYTIGVQNNGPDTAANVLVNVPIGSGATFQSITVSNGACSVPPVGSGGSVECEIPGLANGATATFWLIVRVTATSGSVTTTATVTSTTPDPAPANNSAPVVTPVLAPGSISGRVTQIEGLPVIAGATVTVYNGDSLAVVKTTTTLVDGTYTVFDLPVGRYRVSAHAAGFGVRYFNNQLHAGTASTVNVATGTDTPNVNFLLPTGGGGISGRVTQLDGVTGIPNALVTVRNSTTFDQVLRVTTDISGNYDTGLTLSAGSYKIRVAADGFAAAYHVSAPNAQTGALVAVSASSTTTGINILLSSAAGGISGRVTRGGVGLAGVSVSIRDAITGSALVGLTTDAAGRYDSGLGLLAPRTYKVATSFGGPTPGSAFYNGKLSIETADPVSVTPGAITPNIDIDAPLLSSITGRVTDAGTTANVSGVNIQLLDYATNGFITSVNTAADGTYTFSGLTQLVPGAAFRLRAAKTTYGTQFWNGKPSPGTADVITLGPTQFTADFALTPNAGGISGRVVDAATGLGLPGAFVNILDGSTTNYSINNFITGVSADANGFFNTTPSFGLAPGLYKIVASHSGAAAYVQTFHGNGRDLSTATPITVTASTTTALPDLALPLGATVTGTIRDRATGLGIAGALVNVRRLASSNFFGAYSATTSANGVFTIRGLDFNTQWLLTATAPGYVWGWHAGDPNQPGTDFGTAKPIPVTTTATIVIDMNLEPGGSVIRGRVTRADNGQPVLPGTAINLRGLLPRASSPNATGVVTNALGDFAITSVPPGRYNVEANGVNVPNGNAMGWYPLGSISRTSGLSVTVSGGDVVTTDFAVPAFSGGATPRAIRGTVTGPGGVPVRSGFVNVFEPFAQVSVRVGAVFHDGSYVVDGLPAGRYLVAVGPESGVAAAVYPNESTLSAGQIVDVTAGDAAGINFTLSDQLGSISGRITRSDNGQPIAGAGISVRNFHGNAIRAGAAWILPDGTYSVIGLPPGLHLIQVTAAGFATRWFSVGGGVPTIAGASFVTLTAGANLTGIDVALAPTGGALTGTVRRQGTLDPVVATVIGIRDAATGATVTNISTDVSGAFRTEGLAPGTYKLQAFDSREPRYASQYFNGSNTREGAQTVTVLGAGTTGGVDFLISPAFGTISGTAFDGITPMPGVGISVFDRATGGAVAGGGVTDSLGRYQTTGLAPGVNAYVVRAQALGRALEFWDHAPSRETATAVTVTAAVNTPNIDFTLPPSSDVSGKVNYAGTKPGALRVALYRDGALTQLAYSLLVTDPPVDLGGGLLQFSYAFDRQPPPDTRGVHIGIYFARAFRDSNGNGVVDANEPSGASLSLMVGENHSFVAPDILMVDPPDNDNTAPTATPQNVIAMSGVPQTITLSGSDAETSAANLTYTIVTPPVSGSLATSVDFPRQPVYTSNTGFVGVDSFTFTVTDRASDVGSCPVGCADITSPPVTVTITVGPNAGTSSDAVASSVTAPLTGGVAGPPQDLGTVRINENATGALSAGIPIRIALPAGLTFASDPVVSKVVGNGAKLNAADDNAIAATRESGDTVASFTLASASTAGPATFQISGMRVVIPPGHLGTGGANAALFVSLFGSNPGLTSQSLMVAQIVAAGGAPSVTLAGLSLASVGQGAVNEVVVIEGSNFDATTLVTISGTGVTATVTFDPTKPSQITVELNAAPGAQPGFRDITITNASGSVTLENVIEVTGPPTITETNRTPTNALATNRQGQDITIRGTNFMPPTVSPPDILVTFSGGDITTTAVQYIGPDEISVVVTVADGAPFGTRSVTVVNPNGGFATLVDGVTIGEESVGTAPPAKNISTTPPPPPVIGALTPNRALLGGQIVITGSGFNATPASNIVRFAGSTTAQVVTATPTSLTVVVPNGAADGNVTVTVGTNVSNPATFTVANPTVSGVTPSSAFVGSNTPVIVSGTKFVAGATITFSGAGVATTGALTLTPEGALQTVVTILTGAAPGLRDVTVTNPDGGFATRTGTFEVKPPVTAALELSLSGIATAAYLPSVQSVSATLDANGVCVTKNVVPMPVQVVATFVTTTNAPMPASVTFLLESSAFPGTATNEDCELDPANPQKDYHFVDPATGNRVQQITVAGGPIYPVTLFSNDMGGIVTIRVSAVLADGQPVLGSLKIPVDTDNDTLPDAYEQDVLRNRDKNGANVLDALNGDKNGNGVRDGDDRFARDGLSNFEKYRGVFISGPKPSGPGVEFSGHQRLGSGMRHLFVRGRGFGGDPLMPLGFCGMNPETEQYAVDPRRCPTFQVGLAYERIGVRAVDVTAAFTNGTEFPRQSMMVAGQRTLDLATVVYDGSNCNGGEACDKISKAGSRQWNFRTLAFANFGTPTTYGAVIRVFKRAVDSYFHAKPYEHRTNDPYSVVIAPDGTPMLAPLQRVGDSSSSGGDNGLVDSKERTVNGLLAGDTFVAGRFDLALSALDVNNDGCVELPTVADPTTLTRCNPDADSAPAPQATKQQVVRHLITHELGHAVGVNLHTTDATDVMYQYTTDWNRDGNFSQAAADLVQIHNKGQQ